MKTKILSLILAFTFVLSAPVSANAATNQPITPVSTLSTIEVTVPEEVTPWMASSVEMALKHDIIPDTLKTKYTDYITRGEFSSLVVRLYEKINGTEITERKTFSDTKAIDVEKVAGLGIITGYGDGTFRPDDKLTPEQAAVVVKRLLDKLGYKFYAFYPEELELIKADYIDTPSWAIDAMLQLFIDNIGYGFAPYDPKDDFTVEQSIFALVRVFYLTSNRQFEGFSTDFEDQAKQILSTYKSKYPTGTPWGGEREYPWLGFKAYACSAFTAELSEAIFGDIPIHTHSDYEAIKVGDILKVNDGGHAVIVTDITDKGVVVAEGNFAGKVRWGDIYTKERFVKNIGVVQTRYPKIYSIYQ